MKRHLEEFLRGVSETRNDQCILEADTCAVSAFRSLEVASVPVAEPLNILSEMHANIERLCDGN